LISAISAGDEVEKLVDESNLRGSDIERLGLLNLYAPGKRSERRVSQNPRDTVPD